MRKLFSVGVAMVVLTVGSAAAQTSAPPCDRRMIVPVDSLLAIAKRLHPEAITPASHNQFVVVGLVFDADCHLVHHAIGRRSGPATADTVIARLIPEATNNTYLTSGFAELTARTAADAQRLRTTRDDHGDAGTPWVVWGVQRSNRH